MSDVEKKVAAARDIAAIEAVLNPPAPAPVPKVTKPAKVKSAPVAVAADSGAGARVEDGDDFENDGDPFDTPSNAGARVPEGPAVKAAPVHVPIVPAKPGEYKVLQSGFPDIASDPELIAAIQNVARLEAQLREAEAKLAESCEALGVKHFQHAPGKVEETIERLMAQGADLSAVEEFDARGRLVRRLRGALAIAQKAVPPVREIAMKKLFPAATAALKPSFVDMYRALIELVRVVGRHRHNVRLMYAAGFPQGGDFTSLVTHVPDGPMNVRTVILDLVDRGVFTRDEVADLIAYPEPGF